MQTSRRTNSMHKWVNSGDNGAGQTKSGGKDDEHNGLGSVEIS